MAVYFKNVPVPANGDPAISFAFPTKVASAGVVIAGFDTNFDGNEHFLKKLTVQAFATPDASLPPFNKLSVSGTCKVEDKAPKHTASGSLNGMIWGITPDDTSTVTLSVSWQPQFGALTATFHGLSHPISQSVVYLTGIQLETKDKDFEVTSLTVDAGNSTLEIGDYVDDSMGLFKQTVTFLPRLFVEEEDGKAIALQTAIVGVTIFATLNTNA